MRGITRTDAESGIKFTFVAAPGRGRTASDDVAEKIREARKARHWRPADLATRCRELGSSLSRAAIENIEGGRRDADGRRRRYITVDELLFIADALGVPPALLLPELAQGPLELPLSLHGIDDAMEGLRVTRERILARQTRWTDTGSGPGREVPGDGSH